MTRFDRPPMTPLRRRFIDDLRLRNKSPRTIETYMLRVRRVRRERETPLIPRPTLGGGTK